MSSVTTAAPSAQEHSDRPARHADHAPDWHRQMIREAAYFRAEACGFVGGDPVEDCSRSRDRCAGERRPLIKPYAARD
jgi:hypothetical protein